MSIQPLPRTAPPGSLLWKQEAVILQPKHTGAGMFWAPCSQGGEKGESGRDRCQFLCGALFSVPEEGLATQWLPELHPRFPPPSLRPEALPSGSSGIATLL